MANLEDNWKKYIFQKINPNYHITIVIVLFMYNAE